MKKILLLAEEAFTVMALVHYCGSPLMVILSNGASEGDEGDDVTFIQINILFFIIYLITFALLLLRCQKVIPFLSSNKLVWLFLLLITTSISWSAIPDLTRTRVVAMIGTMAFSLYLASRYTLKEQLKLIAWTFGIVVVGSFMFAIVLPKYGLMGGVHAGAWRGIYTHKNALGKMMAISTIVFGTRALAPKSDRRWVDLMLLGGSIVLLVLSRSSSSLLNVVILSAIAVGLSTLRWNYLVLIPTLMGIMATAVSVYAVLTVNADAIVGLLGKDLTLSGRTNFWPLVLDKLWESPLLGYGFGAFWQGLDGPSAYVWNGSGFKAPNGHNGYLDLCLELGFIGLMLYGTIFIRKFAKSLTYVRHSNTADSLWPTLIFCYIILANLTESSLVLQNSFLWTIQISIFLSLDRVCKNVSDDRAFLAIESKIL
jgi:exopolysaccharide production protein ExoQ